MDRNAPKDAEHSGGASANWVQDAEWAADNLEELLDRLRRDALLELALLSQGTT